MADVEPLAAAGSPSGRWAAYDDKSGRLSLLTSSDTLSVWLEGAENLVLLPRHICMEVLCMEHCLITGA